MHTPKLPKGYTTVNPFIITKDALQLIEFLKNVFNAEEDPASRTMDTDGLLLHSELAIGDSRVMVADTKPNWSSTPSLLQVYVDDIEATLARATKHGAEIVTEPTDFYGDTFSRFIDPWNNLWWVYQHNPQSEDETQWDTTEGDDVASWEPSEEMQYIHDTLLEVMARIGKEK